MPTIRHQPVTPPRVPDWLAQPRRAVSAKIEETCPSDKRLPEDTCCTSPSISHPPSCTSRGVFTVHRCAELGSNDIRDDRNNKEMGRRSYNFAGFKYRQYHTPIRHVRNASGTLLCASREED